MKKETCSFCDEPRVSFIGPDAKPLASLCFDHDKAWTKSNAVARGRMIKRAQRRVGGGSER